MANAEANPDRWPNYSARGYHPSKVRLPE